MSRVRQINRHEIDHESETNTHIDYDYMESVVDNKELPFLSDCYEAFGWEIETTNTSYCKHQHHKNNFVTQSQTILQLKRDNKILNKTELIRLQHNFEACMGELHHLESRKTSKAKALSLIVGFIGALFAIGSILMALASPPHILLSILFVIPALIGCAIPYPLYCRIAAEESTRVTTLIEQKQEELQKLCARGRSLLRGHETL